MPEGPAALAALRLSMRRSQGTGFACRRLIFATFYGSCTVTRPLRPVQRENNSMAPTKRCHYSAAFKRKVVLHAEKTSNLRAQQEFGVHEKNVRRWRKQCAELFGCAATRMAFTGPKTGRHYAVEEVVADFVREQREAGMSVTTEIIQAKAREVAIAKGVS
ncbi:hypothetical protein HPB52_017613 [Rhipicephalus sanguineus]|uniref:Brinker DNA-binding domain-containing protein n=1 Tax=Rhipicephalus sanguineus TaxID=34632 RepID=A0A9D4SZV2_RHISA|nr:hypothetical protein HPB52_017613 [Rhipicephalus sanguineus]